MNLHKLMNSISEINLAKCPNLNIKGITVDPKLCLDGYLYVADIHETVDSSHLGQRLDGRDFITEAIEHGAAAVLTTPDQIVNQSTVPFLHHLKPHLPHQIK